MCLSTLKKGHPSTQRSLVSFTGKETSSKKARDLKKSDRFASNHVPNQFVVDLQNFREISDQFFNLCEFISTFDLQVSQPITLEACLQLCRTLYLLTLSVFQNRHILIQCQSRTGAYFQGDTTGKLFKDVASALKEAGKQGKRIKN